MLHCPVTIHLQNINSKIIFLGISRWSTQTIKTQMRGPYEPRVLCDCTNHIPMETALAGVDPGTEIARLGILLAVSRNHVRFGP